MSFLEERFYIALPVEEFVPENVVMGLYSGHLAAWAIDRSLRRPDQAKTSRDLFAQQMRGRYELARAMALPGVDAEASSNARTSCRFFVDATGQAAFVARQEATSAIAQSQTGLDASGAKIRCKAA